MFLNLHLGSLVFLLLVVLKICACIPRYSRRNVFKSPHAKVWAYVIQTKQERLTMKSTFKKFYNRDFYIIRSKGIAVI